MTTPVETYCAVFAECKQICNLTNSSQGCFRALSLAVRSPINQYAGRPFGLYFVTTTVTFAQDVDDVDVEDRRAQAYASMPASYICELNLLILMLISNTKFGFRFQELWL